MPDRQSNGKLLPTMTAPESPQLTAAELGRLLQAADPAAILVPPRVLRRVIKHHCRMAGLGLQVPHRKCYVIKRDELLQLAARDELQIVPDGQLSDPVILLAAPDPERLALQPAGDVLVKYWRLLFHASLHRSIANAHLTPAEIRDRIHRIGQTAFDEIRTVLRQEKFLLPPRDDATTYEEFAALYWELSYFSPPLLPHYFPAIEDFDQINQLLAADVDAAALFGSTRLAGAPEPSFAMDSSVPPRDSGGPDSSERIVRGAGEREVSTIRSRLMTSLAERAAATGNVVRAAIRHVQAARSAPPNQVAAARAAAVAELQKLIKRLRPALGLTSAEAAGWRQDLPALLAPAARGIWPVEARLLYDLQKICVDYERPISTPAFAEWCYSGFRQPFVMPLPDQPLVLNVKNLRRALGRLSSVRIGESERHALGALLEAALHRAETRLRNTYRPRIVAAFNTVGLISTNYPEQIARGKLIEELLDRASEFGFLTIGDLRDALSRNQLKLQDLSSPREFFIGDPLIQSNRELAQRMPGVYRRGEFYLRWLQRLSSLAFGTQSGRWLTLNFILPFAGAFLAIEGPLQIAHEISKLYAFVMRLVGLSPPLPADVKHHPAPFPLAPWSVIILGGVFLWLLLHVAGFRRRCGDALLWLTSWLRRVLIDWPTALFRWKALQQLLDSPPAQFLIRFILKPLLPAVIAGVTLADFGFGPAKSALGASIVFAVAILFMATRLSRNVEEATADWAVRHWEYLRDFFPGLVRLIIDLFKTCMEGIDRGLYSVDEWLRFRGGEKHSTHALKIVAGLAWAAIAYFVRFLVVLFVEPQINPIKHFPVVTVAHKLLLPMIPAFKSYLMTSHGVGDYEAWLIATIIITKLPGIFGFLVWELKENWRLYRANRPTLIKPVMIGHHGETLPRLVRPGFHSGTLPKLFAKLRRAERRAGRDGDWRSARRYLDALRHNEEAICRFAERELLTYINGLPDWAASPLKLIGVELGSNRIRIEIGCPAASGDHIEVKFEEQSGWLLADLSHAGWQDNAPDRKRAILTLALRGFYKVAGVDLLRSDLESLFAPNAIAYDVTDAGIVFWPTEEQEVVYDLRMEPTIQPQISAGQPRQSLPRPASSQLVFARRPLTWEAWVGAWNCLTAPEALPVKQDDR